MTAEELYRRSPEMRAFIASWIDNRRCPLPFLDFLQEQGMSDSVIEAATWAATEPDRPNGGGGCHGPLPGQMPGNYWWWLCDEPGDELNAPRYVPAGRLPSGCVKLGDYNKIGHPDITTTSEAIIWLLDNWIPKTPPKPTERPQKGKRRVKRTMLRGGTSPA